MRGWGSTVLPRCTTPHVDMPIHTHMHTSGGAGAWGTCTHARFPALSLLCAVNGQLLSTSACVCVLHRTCRATCLCLSAALTCCMPSTSRGHRSTRLQNPPCRLWPVQHQRFSPHHVPPSHAALCAVQSVKEDLEMIREFTEYSAMMEDVTQRLRSEIEQLKLENQSYDLIQPYLAISMILPSSSNHFVFFLTRGDLHSH